MISSQSYGPALTLIQPQLSATSKNLLHRSSIIGLSKISRNSVFAIKDFKFLFEVCCRFLASTTNFDPESKNMASCDVISSQLSSK